MKLPSGRWRIRFFDADGERQSATFATFDLARSELRRREIEAEETAARRERYGSEEMTLREALPRFLAMQRQDPRNTERRHGKRIAEISRHFRRLIEPHLGDRKLADLTPRVLREWLDKLAVTKTARPGELNAEARTLAASTIRQATSALRQIVKANDVQIIVPLPPSLRQKPRRSRPRALQCAQDVRAVVAACHVLWFKVAVAIACYCGARLGEVASLRWRHVGTDTITIALSWEGPLKARYEDDEEAARTVPLDPELATILKAWREATGGGPDDRIVLKNGEPLVEGGDDMADKTRAACKRANVAPVTFHQLRASYATLVADAGLPISKLQVLLGHSDAKTTSGYIRAESQSAALDPRARLSGHVVATKLDEPRDLPN